MICLWYNLHTLSTFNITMTPNFSEILETLGVGGGRRPSTCHCPIWVFYQDIIVSGLVAKHTVLKLNHYLSIIFSVWYHQQHTHYQHLKCYNKYLQFLTTEFTCYHKKHTRETFLQLNADVLKHIQHISHFQQQMTHATSKGMEFESYNVTRLWLQNAVQVINYGINSWQIIHHVSTDLAWCNSFSGNKKFWVDIIKVPLKWFTSQFLPQFLARRNITIIPLQADIKTYKVLTTTLAK